MQGPVRGHACARWTLATMAVMCALLVTAALPAVAEARPLLTGLSGLDSYKPLALQQASAAGVRLVRISVPWASIAPDNEPSSWQPEDPTDPNYSWGSIDSAVKATVETGLTPVLTIEGAPSWAQRMSPTGSCEESPLRPRSVCAGHLRHRCGHPLQRPLRGPAAGALLAGPQRAQPEPLLQPPVRRRQGGVGAALPQAGQRVLLRGEVGRPVEPGARGRVSARSPART